MLRVRMGEKPRDSLWIDSIHILEILLELCFGRGSCGLPKQCLEVRMLECFIEICLKMLETISMWAIRKYAFNAFEKTLLSIRKKGKNIRIQELRSCGLDNVTEDLEEP